MHFLFGKPSLKKKLTKWLRTGGSLREAMGSEPIEINTEEEARLVCAVLDQALSVEPMEPYKEPAYNLHMAVAFFQHVKGEAAARALREHGLPRLRLLVRTYLERRHVPADVVLFVAKQLAAHGSSEDVAILATLARDPQCADQWLWGMVFTMAGHDDAIARALLETLRDPLPEGFCRVAYLDFARERIAAGNVGQHPFDTPGGHAALRAWLEGTDAAEYSYAVSATASLPFISAAARVPLLELAQRHPDPEVQIEAAWARAKLGEEVGFITLIKLAQDPRSSKRAVDYLRELGAEARIPATASAPDFVALAEMANWLAHPNEFGSMPDEITLADTRELYWPPTNDRRRLWVIRYLYRKDDGAVDEGFGLVGSTTFALFGDEADVARQPLDVYATHCCWELECNEDPRAPAERSAAAGRKILAERNPEFRLKAL